jgi:hypothetical protein
MIQEEMDEQVGFMNRFIKKLKSSSVSHQKKLEPNVLLQPRYPTT